MRSIRSIPSKIQALRKPATLPCLGGRKSGLTSCTGFRRGRWWNTRTTRSERRSYPDQCYMLRPGCQRLRCTRCSSPLIWCLLRTSQCTPTIPRTHRNRDQLRTSRPRSAFLRCTTARGTWSSCRCRSSRKRCTLTTPARLLGRRRMPFHRFLLQQELRALQYILRRRTWFWFALQCCK